MDSGYQIEQINKFSVTTWYWKIVDAVCGAAACVPPPLRL
jgi:hypothetical protein